MAKKQKKRNKTNLDIANIVDNEGLSYAIQHYMGSEDFIDLELAALWDQAKDILSKIDSILENAMEEEENEDSEE